MINSITPACSFEDLQVFMKEGLRKQIEDTVNKLIQTELVEFLGYEKSDPSGYNSGNSRNGSYVRTFQSDYGPLHIIIPRDRNGEFQQHTIPKYARRADTLADMVILMYKNGMTTQEIAEVIEKMYGQYYSKQTISRITQTVQGLVEEFHNRQIHDKYVVIYCDSTYLNVRRDSVSKEALHIIVGIDENGYKEILDYALYPTESPSHYQEMLRDLQSRGLKQVLLFTTDGLKGIRDALLEVFPAAEHQTCWTHLVRSILDRVRPQDRAEVANDLKTIYTAPSEAEAIEYLAAFLEKYQTRYKRITVKLSDTTSLFSFYKFPPEIRGTLYTSNIVEAVNKQLKRNIKKKEQFPNEDSMDRFVCMDICEQNKSFSRRRHPGFVKVHAQIMDMFD